MKNVKELARRYGMTPQGFRQFIKKHIKTLNNDGEHVKRLGREWLFDEESVKRLDSMRAVSTEQETVSSPAVIIERQNIQDEKISEQLNRLTELMIVQQMEWKQKQTELEQLMKKLLETEKKLSETQRKLLETERKHEEILRNNEKQKEMQSSWLDRLKFWKKKQ